MQRFIFFIGIVILSSCAQAKSFKILTYNVWAVDAPFQLGSRDIDARLAAIPKAVSETGADLISFQEVWPDKYKKRLIEDFKKLGYAYSYFEDPSWNFTLRGVFGNGLLFISKLPLQIPETLAVRLMMYQTHTRPDEYFAGKGAIHVEVRLNEKLVLSIFNTHMGAVSFEPASHEYSAVHESRRQNQTLELFEFIRKSVGTKEENRAVILAGDFNSHFNKFAEKDLPKELAADYQTLTCYPWSEKCLGLVDTYHITPMASGEVFTVDPVNNPYTDTSPVYRYKAPRRTLDYIFVSRRDDVSVTESKVVLNEKITIPGREFLAPLSDHFGLMTTLAY